MSAVVSEDFEPCAGTVTVIVSPKQCRLNLQKGFIYHCTMVVVFMKFRDNVSHFSPLP